MTKPSRRYFLGAGLALPVVAAPAGGQTTSPSPKSTAKLAPVVRYRTLGKTGLKVSEVGFGNEGVSDVTVYEHALDLGINFFDSALNYQNGNAEIALAKALGSRRGNVILCGRSYAGDAKALAADLDTSLRQMRVDYFDVWYIGNKDRPEQITDEMLAVQAKAQKEGKIRFKGLSTHQLQNIVDFIVMRGHFDVVLTIYNFARGTPRDYFAKESPIQDLDRNLRRMHDAGIGLVAMKVMAGGYRPKDPNEPLYAIRQRPNAHIAALKWALRDQRFATAIPRMTDHDQLVENVRAMREPWTPEDEKTLAALHHRIDGLVCRMCGTCAGACPRGLPVSDLVRFVTYAEGYGDFGMGHSRFLCLPPEVRSVRCENCRDCVVRCAYGVRVRERVSRAQYLFS
jgi:hypothetical protein